jgi:hypothetical protein
MMQKLKIKELPNAAMGLSIKSEFLYTPLSTWCWGGIRLDKNLSNDTDEAPIF